jgi:hypothetical protein
MGKKKPPKKHKKKSQKIVPPSTPEKENPFDFGGLPERNLKKNLGCG